jgi:hypothetical protein
VGLCCHIFWPLCAARSGGCGTSKVAARAGHGGWGTNPQPFKPASSHSSLQHIPTSLSLSEVERLKKENANLKAQLKKSTPTPMASSVVVSHKTKLSLLTSMQEEIFSPPRCKIRSSTKVLHSPPFPFSKSLLSKHSRASPPSHSSSTPLSSLNSCSVLSEMIDEADEGVVTATSQVCLLSAIAPGEADDLAVTSSHVQALSLTSKIPPPAEVDVEMDS